LKRFSRLIHLEVKESESRNALTGIETEEPTIIKASVFVGSESRNALTGIETVLENDRRVCG